MNSQKDIRKRITSVKNTQKITRAMKLVAAAKLRRAQMDALAARKFADELETLTFRISESVGSEAPELMRRRGDIKRLDLVVMSSDRGLCGGFNETLIGNVTDAIDTHEKHGIEVNLIVFGKKGMDSCKKHKLNVIHGEPFESSFNNDDKTVQLSKLLIERFLSGSSDGSFLAYNFFRSSAVQEITYADLLPFHMRRKDRSYQIDYIYEPLREEVINELVNRTLVTLIRHSFKESYASELAARMKAMDAATRNGEEMIEHLTMQYNRARQNSITKELMDIVNGAEALRSAG